MKYNLTLTACAIFLSTTLSGCSGSATLSRGVDSFNTMVNQVSKGIQEGVQAGLGDTNKANVTDWTAYLSPMQKGCDYPDPTEGIPAQYQGSIQNVDKEVYPMPEFDELVYTYNLNNAVAFGYPIQKIEYLVGYEWSYLKIIFKDDGFTALRPTFRPPATTDYPVVYKADGYEADFTYLQFDTSENSITCGFGV